MIIIIAAVAKNRCIGKDNQIPWNLPQDMARFRKLTTNHTVLMGRKTYESILGKLGTPLLHRKNIIITKNLNYKVPSDVKVYHNINTAIEENSKNDIYIIGGADIYSQTIDKAGKLYITEVKKEIHGDTFFPEIDPTKWQQTKKEKHYNFSFCEYTRI